LVMIKVWEHAVTTSVRATPCGARNSSTTC
jgi:hypothetical protein